MTDTIYLERFRDVRDPRLGRHVQHDERSRRFAYRGPVSPPHTVKHERQVPVFDQGAVGSCTGNAAIGCLATGPFFPTVNERDAAEIRTLSQEAAVWVYSQASMIDPFRGQYPPDDTGSDGLSVAKVLHGAGAISGYEHAFGLDQALAALMNTPLITGTSWLEGMYEPDAEGLVRPTGKSVGGHEYVIDEYDAERGWVGFTNSWSERWGLRGRFYMEAEAFGTLLADNGDVTVFVPSTEPAPEPDPDGPAGDDADMSLAAAVGSWARNTHATGSKRVRRAVATWLTAKGL
jgi:hypothetical protein